MQGRIVRFFDERNFGFIRDDEGYDWFFHRDDCEAEPARGARVEFDAGRFRGRDKAVNVRAAAPAGGAA